MNIGEAARRSGVPAKTIRYYESIGLITPAARTEHRYRVFDGNDIRRLQFIQRCRRLGFSVRQVGELLALWSDRGRASADVKAIAAEHLDEIDTRIAELKSMRTTLEHLMKACQGNDRPECPILDDLAGLHSADPEETGTNPTT